MRPRRYAMRVCVARVVAVVALTGMGVCTVGCREEDMGWRGYRFPVPGEDVPHMTVMSPWAPVAVVDGGTHGGVIFSLSFTRDGRYLVSAGADETVRVWDLWDSARPRLVRTIRFCLGRGWAGSIYASSLSPDGRRIAVGGRGFDEHSGLLALADLCTGRVLGTCRGHADSIFALAFSPDGKYLASGSGDRTVRIWSTADGCLGSGTWRCVGVLQRHTKGVDAVAWGPASRRLVSAGRDETLRLWAQEKGLWVQQDAMVVSEGIERVAWSPDGRYIACGGSEGPLVVWDLASSRPLRTVGPNPGAFAFRPDSGLVIGRYPFDGPGALPGCVVLSVSEGRELARYGDLGIISAVAVTFDGGKVATALWGESDIRVWNALTAQELGRVRGQASDRADNYWLAFSPDGSRVCWDYVDLDAASEWSKRWPSKWPPYVQSIFNVVGVDLECLKPSARRPGDWEEACSHAFGVSVVVRGSEKRRLFCGPATPVWETSVVHEGRNRRVQLQRVSRAVPSYRFPRYTLTGNGRFVVLATPFDLKLYSTETGDVSRSFVGHTDSVQGLAVSRDGRLLVSASLDRTVRLWNMNSGELLLSVFVLKGREWIAWTPHGYYKSSAGGDRLMGWHLNRGVDKAAGFVYAWQMRKRFERPDILERIIETGSVAEAARAANAAAHRGEDQLGAIDNLLDLLPPEITLHEPQYGVEVTDCKVRVRATIDSRLPLARLALLVNGRPMHVQERPSCTLDLTATVTDGDNDVGLVAENAGGTSQVAWARVWAKVKDAAQPNLHVLAVGVSGPGVRFAASDARGIAAAFGTQQRKQFAEVAQRVLADSGATRAAVLHALATVGGRAVQRDLVVVALAGTCAQEKKDAGFFFVPHDGDVNDLRGTCVPWIKVQNALAGLPCRVLLILDLCNGRSAVGSGASGNADLTAGIKDSTRPDVGLAVLMSRSGLEASHEADAWGHAAFALALIEGLTTDKALVKRVPRRDARLFVDELAKYVTDRVAELTDNAQHPQLVLGHVPPFVVASMLPARTQGTE